MSGNGSASMRDRRRDAAGDQHGQRSPHGVVRRGAGGVGVAGEHRDHVVVAVEDRRQLLGVGEPDRVHESRCRSRPAGGAGRPGPARRAPGRRAARRARRACPAVSSPGRSAPPRRPGSSSRASRTCTPADAVHLVDRAVGRRARARRRTPRAGRGCPAGRASAPARPSAPQHRGGLVVLLGGAVVGDVAGHQDDVDGRVEGGHVVEHAARPVGRRPAAAEVGVAEVGDDEHRAIVTRGARACRRDMKRPPAYPTELACPCCLPALGEFGKMPPRGGLPESLGEPRRGDQRRSRPVRFPALAAEPVASSAEDSPSGLWRSLGKRVGLTALRGSNPLSSATPTGP